MNIITEYPLWFIIFCLICGGLYAYVLYGKQNRIEFPKKITRMLTIMRFVAVTIIAFLLLSPLIKAISRHVEKPVIIIMRDNSKSIITNKDSAFNRKEFLPLLEKFKEKLNNNVDVVSYSFGESVREENISKPFSEKLTDISGVFDHINNIYSNRNVGAVVLATDGIYNKGESPLYASAKVSFPIYTVALGDTDVQKDVYIKKVNYNKTAFLGNTFPVEVVVYAGKCKGSRVKLSVSKGDELVFSKDLDINNDVFNQVIPLQIEAKKAGLQYYKIELSPVKDEMSSQNNSRGIFINVMSSKEKILILSSSPHPDVSAIKQAIESNYNYECEAYVLNDFNKNINEYNVVILHQIPSVNDPASLLLSNIIKNEIPTLYIIGSKSNINILNNQMTGLAITESRLSSNEAMPSVNSEFPSFSLSRDVYNIVNTFPPLLSPFGNYNQKTSANVLFYQRIGNVTTRKPLVMFSQTGNIRAGVIAGEGIWKWRINNYMQKNNHDVFNKLINKMVQYLSVRTEKSRFRIISPNSYLENEQISFDAEVFNDSYELINEPDVNMNIINKENKKYPYVFSKTANAYHLNAGTFPPGIYKYNASVKVGNNIYQKDGEFSISEINAETMNTVADHRLLYNISKKHNAEMYYPAQLDKLADDINKREDIKPISYSQMRFTDIMNLRWVFFLVVALLAAEWFVRKWSGSY